MDRKPVLALLLRAATAAAVLSLNGCGSIDRPYSDQARIDETGADLPGTITLSAPQLYGRETLINDRRGEAAFLKSKLALVNADFIPQPPAIVRNLQDIFAASISASVTADAGLADRNRLAEVNNSSALQLAERQAAYRNQAYSEFMDLDRQIAQLTAEKQGLITAGASLESQKATASTDGKKAIEEKATQNKIDLAAVDGRLAAANTRLTGLRSSLGLPTDANALAYTSPANAAVDTAKLEAQVKALRDYFATESSPSKFTSDAPKMAREDSTSDKKARQILSDTEQLQEIEAYRRDLRAAIAAVELDDLHDYRGNALYQLDFRLSLFPGTGIAKNKYGMVDVSAKPPKLETGDLAQMYEAWIQHVAADVNRYHKVLRTQQNWSPISGSQPKADQAKLNAWTYLELYRDLGTRFDLYNLTEASLLRPPAFAVRYLEGLSRSEACEALLPSLHYAIMKDADSANRFKAAAAFALRNGGAEFEREARDYWAGFFSDAGWDFQSPSLCTSSTSRARILDWAKIPWMWDFAFANALKSSSVGNIMMMTARDQSLNLTALLNERYAPQTLEGPDCTRIGPMRQMLLGSLRGYQRNSIGEDGRGFSSLQSEIVKFVYGASYNAIARCFEAESTAFTNFRKIIETNGTLNGSLRVLSATPTERGQTVSTIANAMQSFQAALSLAATAPDVGVSGNAGAQAMQRAAASISAVERIPRIVSYADQSSTTQNFGWVVAPKAMIDTQKNQLTLEQVMASFQTSVEISAPGWWPHVTLLPETYWAGNLADAKSYSFSGSRPADWKAPEIKVQFPVKSVDYDGLTQFIFGDSGALGEVFLKPQIDSITPGSVSGCAGQTQFVLKGKNVWRGTKIFVGGLEATDVLVLPNMEGVSFKVDVKSLFTSPTVQANKAAVPIRAGVSTGVRVPVVVATRDGVETNETITLVVPSGSSTATCDSYSAPVAIPEQEWHIVSLSPTSIRKCTQDVSFVAALSPTDEFIRVENLIATLGGVKGQVEAFRGYEGRTSRVTVVATFPHASIPPPGTYPLMVRHEAMTAVEQVTVAACS